MHPDPAQSLAWQPSGGGQGLGLQVANKGDKSEHRKWSLLISSRCRASEPPVGRAPQITAGLSTPPQITAGLLSLKQVRKRASVKPKSPGDRGEPGKTQSNRLPLLHTGCTLLPAEAARPLVLLTCPFCLQSTPWEAGKPAAWTPCPLMAISTTATPCEAGISLQGTGAQSHPEAGTWPMLPPLRR